MALPPTASRPPAWPIVVAGGGIASLAFGLAVAHGAGRAAEVAILDPRIGVLQPDPRAYAISPAVVAMLDALAVWAALREHAQPIGAMRITDSRLADAIRPDYLGFGRPEDGPVAYVVEAAILADALRQAAEEAGVTQVAAGVRAAEPDLAGIAIETQDGDPARRAALLVAADGARSRLREEAGIGWVSRDYRQAGLVATVSHARPHGGVAVQHFLPGGPFAILPLAGPGRHHPHRSSIVWTEGADRARAITRLAREAAAAEIAPLFGPGFGEIALDTPLLSHPLSVGLARRFVGERLALLGDAAHVVHPLAGQGLNLGLGDAAALAEAVVDRIRIGLDPGAPEVLDAYERQRRPHAVALAGLTDGLNRLFSNDLPPVRALRDLGLGLVDRSRVLKKGLAEAAAGRAGTPPRLMRGQSI